MKSLKQKAGLILVEAIMAVSMMGIGVVILGSIINSGVDTLELSRDYLTAQNLATEGVEIIKGIRDTNWLLKPNDRSCWLRLSPDSDCSNTVIFEKSYIPLKLSGGRNYLSQQSKPLDLGSVIEYPKYRGLDLAVRNMKLGDRWALKIPSNLAFGDKGVKPSPGNFFPLFFFFP